MSASEAVLAWTQMVHSPFGFSTGPQSCCGIQVSAATQEGNAREAVGEQRDSFGAERIEGVAVEAMTRRDPDSWVKPVRAQNPQALDDPRSLGLRGHTGKLRSACRGVRDCGHGLRKYGDSRAGQPRPLTLPTRVCAAKRQDPELQHPVRDRGCRERRRGSAEDRIPRSAIRRAASVRAGRSDKGRRSGEDTRPVEGIMRQPPRRKLARAVSCSSTRDRRMCSRSKAK